MVPVTTNQICYVHIYIYTYMICPTEIAIFSGKFTIFSGKFTMFSSLNCSNLGLVFMKGTPNTWWVPRDHHQISSFSKISLAHILPLSDPLLFVIYPHENSYAHFCWWEMALSWVCHGLPGGNQACLVGKAFVNGGLTGKNIYLLLVWVQVFTTLPNLPQFPQKISPSIFSPKKISGNPSKVTNLEPRGVKVQALWPSLPRHVLPQHLTLPLELISLVFWGISLKKQEICPHETAIHEKIWFFFQGPERSRSGRYLRCGRRDWLTIHLWGWWVWVMAIWWYTIM